MINNQPATPQHLTRPKALIASIRHFDRLPFESKERITASAVLIHFSAGRLSYIEGEP